MNRTVLITGGSRGIGAATVRTFALAGWHTAFCYRYSEEQAQALTRELSEQGCSVRAIQADVTDKYDVEVYVQRIREELGPICALVANAGISQQKMFCDITSADWDNLLCGNLKSVYYCIQSVLPDMVAEKQGSIVTVSSVWGITGASCESHYAASKAGLIGLTKSLAQELGLSGIRVNCVAPGVIATEMNSMHSQETLAELAANTALGRVGTAQEVADAIYFLSGEKAAFITGQVLGVTGGFGS